MMDADVLKKLLPEIRDNNAQKEFYFTDIIGLAIENRIPVTTLKLGSHVAQGGQVISIGTAGNDKRRDLSKYFLTLPKAEWLVNRLLEAIPVQLLAYHVASALGHDVDQPRNLAKSVTVE